MVVGKKNIGEDHIGVPTLRVMFSKPLRFSKDKSELFSCFRCIIVDIADLKGIDVFHFIGADNIGKMLGIDIEDFCVIEENRPELTELCNQTLKISSIY